MAGPRNGLFASLAARGYPPLWASSWFYNATRWMGLFLGSYLVNERTESAFLVQVAGAAFFAPMFFAGPLAGVIADRFDRKRALAGQLAALIPLAVAAGYWEIAGEVPVGVVYLLLLAMGIGGVIDWTCRRALVFDLVGEELATNALALEALSLSSGSMLGSMFGGAVIEYLGIGQAFILIAAFYGATLLLLAPVPSPVSAGALTRGSLVQDLREGFVVLGRNRALVSILGVTLVMNLAYFSFLPLVPVFADRLEVSPLWTGILAGGQGIGMVVGAFVLAARPPGRRGVVYVGGSFAALGFLLIFAAVPVYAVALTAVVAAGIGASAFGTMQGLLVMLAATPAMRGRAMGLLSMAIGALPFGMLILGGLAQSLGAPVALGISVTGGALILALWLARWPEALRVE